MEKKTRLDSSGSRDAVSQSSVWPDTSSFDSPRFHGYLLAQIEKQASEATGAEVRVQNFALHLSQLAADAYGITVRGNEPTSARPLVQADQLRIRLKIVSLLRKKIDLNEIILRHPVVNLLVRKDGTTNLPTPPKSNKDTSSNLFDLGIQHVLLEHGEIYYNDVKTPLDAELHDLQVEIKAQLIGKGYDGNAFLSKRTRFVWKYETASSRPHRQLQRDSFRVYAEASASHGGFLHDGIGRPSTELLSTVRQRVLQDYVFTRRTRGRLSGTLPSQLVKSR